MTREEFMGQLVRLTVTYGDKNFPSERIGAIWERVRAYSVQQFEWAITYVIGENFHPPTLSKISEAMSMYRRPGHQSSMALVPDADNCEACHDHGYGFNGDLAVRCSCEAGARLSPDDLAHHQFSYDKGKALVRGKWGKFLPDLPYDPKEREGA